MRRGGKKPANFEPDSAFRKDDRAGKKAAPDKVKAKAKAKKKTDKAQKNAEKTRKIAAAAKAKRASKKNAAQ